MRHWCIATFLAATFTFSADALTQPPADKADLLKLPILPVEVTLRGIPLTEALARLGIYVRNGYVLFGAEVHLKDGKEPTVDLHLQPGSRLGGALTQIFRQLPEYRFEVVGEHLINVYPAGAETNPEDLLNVRVDHFDVENEQADAILSRPAEFIPELKNRLEPKHIDRAVPAIATGLSSVHLAVALHLRDVTVRQILNATTEATEKLPANVPPFGWVYSFQPDPRSPLGGKHSWKVHSSAPMDWKKQLAQPQGARP